MENKIVSNAIVAERQRRMGALPWPLEPVVAIPFDEVGVDMEGQRIYVSLKALALAFPNGE